MKLIESINCLVLFKTALLIGGGNVQRLLILCDKDLVLLELLHVFPFLCEEVQTENGHSLQLNRMLVAKIYTF